ncbi:MAG: hypothetical protein JAY85_15755 [Candidatus Thiodiazotropha weberae]|uniref:Uncharacterized protein n=1 Tax=Candidatus Thiodiazotropha endoloripes TaxID=1818881 RepID=A0A1E2UNP8_9GAMM|nr:hypothetical protein [Candidatus Thiodiazotropha endoloripes]MCG7899898.1 hypothetical protein [Candidatus Thiodiazotropha weberae]MCG7901036.1 hypothetical protein [Candidatus Thiodiazotropha weberae]MCG7913365.1 hypothetical protein [Candidatus Thiodiazotropha weberae]ODB94926.1 hypothetical protein A3194_19845 [Candidatus Thiodiazotropha endoloripes]ODB96353.1 hypothetical protein A3196_06015 [Candidatus Thiodiazotropha endoloripes]
MPRTPLVILTLSLTLSSCDFAPTPSNVKVSRQPADGLTQNSFGQSFLQQLVDEVREGAELSLSQAYDRNNIPAAERISKPQAVGRYEWMGDKQLAVIDLSYSYNPMRVMRVVGIEADQMVTINCISPSGIPLKMRASEDECSEAIAEQFNLQELH